MKFKASDLANRLFLAALGLAALTKEKAKKIVEDLLGKEKISKRETSVFIGELLDRGKETQKKLLDLIKREVGVILAKVDLASKADVEELKKKIEKLEGKLKNK